MLFDIGNDFNPDFTIESFVIKWDTFELYKACNGFIYSVFSLLPAEMGMPIGWKASVSGIRE